MKLLKQNVELLAYSQLVGEQEPETSPEKLIELAGRTCYKSEEKITPTSRGEYCENSWS